MDVKAEENGERLELGIKWARSGCPSSLQKQDAAWHGTDAQQTPVPSEEHKVIGPWGKKWKEPDTKFYQVHHVASVS